MFNVGILPSLDVHLLDKETRSYPYPQYIPWKSLPMTTSQPLRKCISNNAAELIIYGADNFAQFPRRDASIHSKCDRAEDLNHLIYLEGLLKEMGGKRDWENRMKCVETIGVGILIGYCGSTPYREFSLKGATSRRLPLFIYCVTI